MKINGVNKRNNSHKFENHINHVRKKKLTIAKFMIFGKQQKIIYIILSIN